MELNEDIFEELNTKNLKYLIITNNYHRVRNVVNSRPSLISANESNFLIYKVKKCYKLHVPSNFTTCESNESYIDYIRGLIGSNEDMNVVVEHSYSDNSKFYSDVTTEKVNPHQYGQTLIFFKKYLERIHEYNKTEQNKLKEIERRKSERNVIEKLLLNTVVSIAEEYGIEYCEGIFKFKGRKELNKFIYDALNETIFKKLRENGFVVYKTGYNRNLKEESPLFTINDLGIPKEENK